ncbi:MAG: N-6 DNA methylase [Candidatus Micrarchaeaceae archaeon]
MLTDVINNIRDILRTENIVGKNSINYCISFLVIRLLDQPICQKLGIDEKYTFNNLINNGNIDKDRLYEKIYNPKSQDCLILHLILKLNMNFLRGFKVKSAENLYNILLSLKDLNIKDLNEKCDLIGSIYEEHLKTGTTNGRDLGQFFTDRNVIKYIVEMINPQIGETVCDPAMGTGGFLITYINSLNVNWSIYKNYIYGFDIDQEIANLSSLNLLLKTGEKFPNLCCNNSLSINIQNKFDVILTNIPMGVQMDYNLCSDKIKELKIKTSKCEPLFIQLILQILNSNGRACVIVSEGFLANRDNGTRNYLINNFEVRKIVHLNGKFFLNTNIDTYILYIINSGRKTEKIDFYVYTKDLVEKKVFELNYQNIVDMDYNLLYRLYIPSVKYNQKYTYYKIKDICVFLRNSDRSASYGKDSGLYPFFTASKKIKYCDTYDYDVESIIIAKGAQAIINYGIKFSCANQTYVLTTKYQDILVMYIYYYLKCNIHLLQNGFYGTGLKHTTKSYIENIDIPVPSLEEQINLINQIYESNAKIYKLSLELENKRKQIKNIFK